MRHRVDTGLREGLRVSCWVLFLSRYEKQGYLKAGMKEPVKGVDTGVENKTPARS